MKSTRTLALLLIAGLAPAAALPAQEAQTCLAPYGKGILKFDVPKAGTEAGQGTMPIMFNALGFLTGNWVDGSGATHGFLRTPAGQVIPFDPPGSQSTSVWSINVFGQIAGYFTNAEGAVNGFLRSPMGVFTVFDAGGAGSQTCATDLNLLGETGGWLVDAAGMAHGFLRSPLGTITVYDAPYAGASDTGPAGCIGLNDEGAVAGNYQDAQNVFHGFLRTANGAFTSFDAPQAGTVPGSYTGTLSSGLNDAGCICGVAQDASYGFHGFIRAPGGTMTGFDAPGASTLSGPYSGTMVNSLNASGYVAGYFTDAQGVEHGFVRSPAGVFTRIDVPGAGTAPGQGTNANQLSDGGVVQGNYVDPQGVYHGFICWP